MAWTTEEGTAIFTDLVESTRIIERLADDELIELFFNGPRQRYFDCLLGEIGEIGEGQPVRRVRSTGDGLAITVIDATAGVRLATRLQTVCDRFASEVLEQGLPESRLDERRGSFHFATRIGLTHGRIVGRPVDQEPTMVGFVPHLPLKEFTGPTFYRAARITDKARNERGVWSPLLDHQTWHRVDWQQLGEVKAFFTGQFKIDTKDPFQPPEARPRPTDLEDFPPIFSTVPVPSIVEDLAELFEASMHAHYERRRGDALEMLLSLGEKVESRSEEIAEQLGRVALERWRQALRHYSYVPINLGAPP